MMGGFELIKKLKWNVHVGWRGPQVAVGQSGYSPTRIMTSCCDIIQLWDEKYR